MHQVVYSLYMKTSNTICYKLTILLPKLSVGYCSINMYLVGGIDGV